MNLKGYAKERIKNKCFMIMLFIFMTFAFSSMIYFAIIKQIRNMLLALVCTLLAIPVFIIGEYVLKLEIVPFIELLLLILITGGVLLGPCYDWYFKFTWWDDFLHGLSGTIFMCFGVAIMEKVSQRDFKDNTATCLTGGFFFCLGILFLWEMFEYFGTTFLHLDMQEDCLIYSFDSFFLAGSHNEVMSIDGITKTIIYYGDNQSIVLDGYLDIGLYDTLNDLLIGMLGAIAGVVVLAINKALHRSLEKYIIPKRLTPTNTETVLTDLVDNESENAKA